MNVKGKPEDIRSGRSLAWTRTSACHADDPGSNPGGRTTKDDAKDEWTKLKEMSLLRY